jgi:hypothetical protein
MATWGGFTWGDGTIWGGEPAEPAEPRSLLPDIPTLSSAQEALDAFHTYTRGLVYVGDTTVDASSWSAQFGVDQASSTCRFTVPLPRPDSIVGGAEVTIVGGHNDLVGVLFSGRVISWDADMALRGDTLTVTAVGWLSLLNDLDLYELTFPGPVSLSELFDALCARRGVPSYRADAVTDPTGTITVQYGTNPQINDGKVIIPDNQTPLTALNNRADLVGYRIYDTGTTARLTRVSGAPNTDPVVTFTEGTHLISARRRYDTGAIVNYPDIHGQTYEDALGATVPIRAFPATVIADPLIPVNAGVRKRRVQSSLIESQQLAEIVMAVEQENSAAPDTRVRWEAVAVPGLHVGDVVELVTETTEGSGVYWLTSMDITSSDRGLTATYEGWAGGGTASPVGENREIYRLQEGAFHIGDEYVGWYAVPSPTNTYKRWDVSILDRATAVNVRGWHHSTNAQNIGGVETALEVTKWRVWPAGTTNFKEEGDNRPVTSGNMPTLTEDYRLRRPYSTFAYNGTTWDVTNAGYWTQFAVNLRSLDPGDYIFEIVCGQKAGYDDMEARLIHLEIWGRAEPAIVPQETE